MIASLSPDPRQFQALLFGSLGLAFICALAAWVAFRDAREAEAECVKLRKQVDDLQLVKSINNGTYRVPPAEAPRVLRDLFAPSVERDVEDLRAWRQRRALTGPDHKTRYSFGGDSDAEIAAAVCAMWLEEESE